MYVYDLLRRCQGIRENNSSSFTVVEKTERERGRERDDGLTANKHEGQ